MLLDKLNILTSQKALKITFWEVISYIAKWDKKLKMWLLTFKKLKKVINSIIQTGPNDNINSDRVTIES